MTGWDDSIGTHITNKAINKDLIKCFRHKWNNKYYNKLLSTKFASELSTINNTEFENNKTEKYVGNEINNLAKNGTVVNDIMWN